MPTETFFNLPEDKRIRILDAAKQEFTENVLLKSRVSNIIKNAGIPRGSFYQYFEDLEDLYYYVIDEVFDNLFISGNQKAREKEELFEFVLYSFDHDYDLYANHNQHRFVMNVLRSIADNEEYQEKFNNRRLRYIESNLDILDLSNIRLSEKEDLVKMYQMIQDIKRNIIRKSLLDNNTREQAKEDLRWYVDILKRGLLKEE